jgi:colanic acid biosynthesis glycosyl transferase WcaI
LIEFVSFALSSLLVGVWSVGRQDIVVVESPPLFSAIAAIPLNWITRGRLLAYVADIWPDILIRTGRVNRGIALRFMELMERALYRASDLVALTTPGARRQVQQAFPNLATTVLSNGVDIARFSPDFASPGARARLGVKESDFLVGYIGLHGVFQGLSVVLDAAERLRHRKEIRFVLIGNGVEKEALLKEAERRRLENLHFFPPVQAHEVPELLASCDASVVPLSAALPGTMPSKTYEALAAGVPVLAVEHCEAAELVRKHDLGRVFEPHDGGGLADAVMQLLDLNIDQITAMRARCRQTALHFDRDRQAEFMERVLVALNNGDRLPEMKW